MQYIFESYAALIINRSKIGINFEYHIHKHIV